MCGDPNVQVNVNHCGDSLDASATWKVEAVYDDVGVNAFDFGPCDLATARAVLIALASRTNVRQATIIAIS